MKHIKHLSLLFIVAFAQIAFSQEVKFEAKVSKNKLGQNERFRIDFEMNQDGDHFKSPGFQNFDVIGGPNTSVSNSWINGKRSFSKTYSYFLSPKKQGTFTIGQASIQVEGTEYKTKPISITVTKPVKGANGANGDAIAQVMDNIHLVAELSNSKPYLNEAITVVYKLYVSPTTTVSNWREKEKPKYNDFWSQDIELKGLKIERGTYKNESYRYVVLRKTVLYPQKTGKLVIEPLALDIVVDVPTNRRDIFGGRLMRQVNKTISAGTRTLNVKPLPEENKPADFTGAVGDFNFNLSLSKKSLKADESLQLKVAVSGKGNLRLFELPKVKLPSSLEVYEPEHKENVRVRASGMSGTISDSYTIVPQYQGKYPIPNISFSYFDLKTKTYKQISSGEQIIDVIDGPVNNTTSDDNIAATNTTKKQIVLDNNQFVFVKTKTNFKAIKNEQFFNTKWFWASLFSPLLAIPLALVYRRKRDTYLADVVGNRIRKADKLAKRYLGEAKKSIGQKEAFYVALEKALHNYLKAKLSIETSDFSKDKIQDLLANRDVETEAAIDFNGLLEHCELARYTPITTVTMEQDYEKAAKTINLIDKQIR